MVTVWCGDGHESTIEPTVQSVTEGGGDLASSPGRFEWKSTGHPILPEQQLMAATWKMWLAPNLTDTRPVMGRS